MFEFRDVNEYYNWQTLCHLMKAKRTVENSRDRTSSGSNVMSSASDRFRHSLAYTIQNIPQERTNSEQLGRPCAYPYPDKIANRARYSKLLPLDCSTSRSLSKNIHISQRARVAQQEEERRFGM